MNTPKDIREKDAAARFGLGAQAMVDFRAALCTEGVHWRVKGRNIMWTEVGLVRVAELVNLSLAELPRVEEKGEVTLWVHPKKTANPKILFATNRQPDPKDMLGSLREAPLLRVVIKTKDNFRCGMAMRCVHVDADLYRMVGNCPRFQGKY